MIADSVTFKNKTINKEDTLIPKIRRTIYDL